MDFILDNLAIGTAHEAHFYPQEIEAYLNVAEEANLVDPPEKYLKTYITDMHPIPIANLKEAISFIEQNINEKKILVFCSSGVGRSPSVVIAFLCVALNFTFGEAVEYVARKKPYMSILPELVTTIDRLKDELKVAA